MQAIASDVKPFCVQFCPEGELVVENYFDDSVSVVNFLETFGVNECKVFRVYYEPFPLDKLMEEGGIALVAESLDS